MRKLVGLAIGAFQYRYGDKEALKIAKEMKDAGNVLA